MQHRAARLAPPPPPAGWVWPREGEVIEVEVDEEGIPITWHKAKVITVLIDGWFSAHITTPQDAIGWDDWFTWREEGTDWRRAMPPKAEAQKRKAEVQEPDLIIRRKQEASDRHATACNEAMVIGAQAKADFASSNSSVQRAALEQLCDELLRGSKAYYTRQRVLRVILGSRAQLVPVMKQQLVVLYAPQLKALGMWAPEWEA